MTAVALPRTDQDHDLVDLAPDELARMLDELEELSGSLDVHHVLTRVARAARQLLASDMSTVLILEPEREMLVVAASDGIDPDLARRLSTPVGENLAGLAAQLGQCVSTSDITADTRSALRDVCAGHIRSALLAPMMRDGRVLGVVGIECRAAREFSERDERLLRVLAKHGAAAIENANLYAAETQRVQQLNDLLSRLNVQNDIMRRSREAHDRLTEAALQGVGHSSLLHVLVDLVPVPLVLTNQFGARLCAAAPPGEERLEQLWTACEAGPAFARQLERLRSNAGLAEPARPREAGSWRIVVVTAGGELLGALVVLDHLRLEELHMVVLEEAANVIATELLRERSIAETEARASGDLVRMLVARDGWGKGAQERAALLGHDLTRGQCVIASGIGADGTWPEMRLLVSATRRAAACAGLCGLVGECDGVLAVLLASGDRAVSRESTSEWIAGFVRHLEGRVDEPVTFGVSPITADGSRIREGFDAARQALAVSRLGKDRRVTHFDDVQLIASLIDITNEHALGRYIESTIGKLRDYDRRQRTELAHTLEIYLDCSGVARHAAKALYLHPHSLRYRLRRICEIQELDLADPMTRLTAHLALKLSALVSEPS
jgi:sugar diacid utilization regulator/putative methionine-R-sulfoxide reductase with GAF domain